MRGLNAPGRNETLTAAVQAVELIAFLSDSTDGHQILSPVKFIEMMGLDIASFARDAHVHQSTVIRAPGTKSIQSHLRASLQVLAAAASQGDLQDAIFRYRNEPLAPFGYKTAESLVAEGRAADVLNLLESLQAGFVG